MHVVVIVGVRFGVEQQLAERQLSGFLCGRGDVVQQRGVDAPAGGTHHVGVGVQFADPGLDALQRVGAVGDLVELVDDDQCGRAVAGRRVRVPVDGVEVGGGVDHVDDAAGSDSVDTAEPDDAGDRDGVGQSARLDDDGVEAQLRVREPGQREVESALVRQTADAAAGDRRGLVDLARHQSGVDVEFAKVVDHDADPGIRAAQHVIKKRGLSGAEIAGQRDHRYRLHSTAGYRDSRYHFCLRHVHRRQGVIRARSG